MPSALNIEGLNKHYHKQRVLSGVSLQVETGQFIGLIGGNGVGKTSLIKCLLDFCDFQSGQIKIFDVDHKDYMARTRLAFLPERFAAPYFVTGREFLVHLARMYRLQPDQQTIEKAVNALGLDIGALEKPVHALSKGMAQKIGLAAVLSSRKDLLILDEPMSGLDPRARAMLKRYLLDLKVNGTTLFFSTHLLADLDALCDQVVILYDGRIKFVGSPSDCCAQFGADNLDDAYISCIS